MKTKGKAWQLVVTALLIVVFVYTAFFGVAAKYGDVTTTYIKGAKDIRFGVDIKGGVNVTFVPSDGYDATDEQLDAARLVIENRLVALNVTDYELYVDNNSDRPRGCQQGRRADFGRLHGRKRFGTVRCCEQRRQL